MKVDRNTCRYLVLAAVVVMTMCLGATYAWSVFVPLLKQLTGLGQGAVQVPFSVFYVAFPATTIFAGMLFSRIGPRPCAVAGGILFGGGWLLAGFGGHHFVLTILGIGVLGGIGVGLAYIVPIACAVLWFPRHKGLVTGCAVAGFGGGAALISKVADHLMSMRGLTPFQTFQVLGLVFLLVVALAGLAMRLPPDAQVGRARLLNWTGVMGERTFWILYLAMFVSLTAGFAVNANLKQLYPGKAAQAGVTAVALFALANALGRILWGLIFDRIRSLTAIRVNMILQALILLGAGLLLRSPSGLQVLRGAGGT